MQATKQQQIVVYFIEEAKEHLDTIERGLLNLQETLSDPEQINELFRAAHSVKGGAAMLGFIGIQKVSHHLEDCFKLLKENHLKPNQHLENLFLKEVDILKELVGILQSPYGPQDADLAKMMKTAQPIFDELDAYLQRLLKGETTPSADTAKLAMIMNTALKKMLELFKQGDTITTRKQLIALCAQLGKVHGAAEWQLILKAVQQAIANPKNTYKILAPIVIKDLKQAGDWLVAGQAGKISVSAALQKLSPAPTPPAASAASNGGVARPTAQQPTVGTEASSASGPRKISIPHDPRGAARVLLETFNKQQLIELAEFLMKAIQ